MSEDKDQHEDGKDNMSDAVSVILGATVPTGFEYTAAEEVKEKTGADVKISKDRGRIYFRITTQHLHLVHKLRSVDNLFVVVAEFVDYEFKDTKEETLKDFQKLASKLPWTDPLEVWKINNSLKKKKWRRKGTNLPKAYSSSQAGKEGDFGELTMNAEKLKLESEMPGGGLEENGSPVQSDSLASQGKDSEEVADESSTEVLKFRVTCNRAGEKHNFTSNEAARDFGGAVQDFFQWKPDMTKFDIEVLLNIHNSEVVVGIALTEESLHRRNITHFGPTTLRSTLAYGMLRLCKPQISDVIIDPMCGTGAIPLEGAIEWKNSYYLAGDNNDQAVKRTLNNINHIHRKRQENDDAPWGLPVDTLQWDLCHLPVRTASVDIIITDMPFGKRMGSKKKNWDLYPSCLREMARVCRPGTGKAVLLTQDKKCFAKALSRMGGLWRKSHTVWVNIGGLHAGVFLLKRVASVFGETPEDLGQRPGPGGSAARAQKENEGD
ncbi:tRNA (guanine(6)-N2)-methyltransferase THUMP3 [Paramormyrops kingsleyae]|uniref:THUMP domain containing 3 n=1 Tax=Paramormyrops kingsleyae TaxID=1676925 RepID=A0A3B3SVN3_9TELE|nr:THUMP domain-containing protein 3 [Paramormyrops kingsleyae]XP_023646794.1 THUMP domain-containing protein 3 [Paramormyrops kingsleyae]